MTQLKILFSVDWEGTDLELGNLQRINKFKARWNAPITHYLNAGYYTNPDTAGSAVTDSIRWVLSEEDELGLHLHTPRHLIQRAGVEQKSSPCFSKYGDYNGSEQVGQEIMLHAYEAEEIDKLISFATKLLNNHGFKDLKSFRAGGWMSNDIIHECLASYGFFYESSATVASFLNGSSWEGDNLQRYIAIIWSHINHSSTPYLLNTPKGSLLEIPNNLGAIDYWQPDWIPLLASQCIEHTIRDSSYIVVINSHQETAAANWDKLDQFLDLLNSNPDVSLKFITNSQVNQFVETSLDHTIAIG